MKNAHVAQARIDTPLGAMTAVATAHGIAGLWFDGQRHHPGPLTVPVDAHNPHIVLLRRELAAYWAGGKTDGTASDAASDAANDSARRGASHHDAKPAGSAPAGRRCARSCGACGW